MNSPHLREDKSKGKIVVRIQETKDLPSDFDYKFAEQTIEAYYAIYERTGEFMPETQLKRIAREIKKMGKELATGAGMGLIAAVCLYAPLIKGM